jgi:hypothetical protein
MNCINGNKSLNTDAQIRANMNVVHNILNDSDVILGSQKEAVLMAA